MSFELLEKDISCPYCGETISVLVDTSYSGEKYIEDCQVCCRPIIFVVNEDYSGEISVSVHTEDDVV